MSVVAKSRQEVGTQVVISLHAVEPVRQLFACDTQAGSQKAVMSGLAALASLPLLFGGTRCHFKTSCFCKLSSHGLACMQALQKLLLATLPLILRTR